MKRWPLLPLLLLLQASAGAQSGSAPPARGCPALDGHYKPAQPGQPRADALTSLRAESAGFLNSELRLAGATAVRLELYIKSGSTGAMPTNPSVVLYQGQDYRCDAGALVFPPVRSATRQHDGSWYEGESVLRLSPGPQGSLALVVTFSGRERITLYQYDSARLSVPKLGTGKRFTDQLSWPPISPEDAAAPTLPRLTEPVVPLTVRPMLGPKIIGNLTLGGISPAGDAARVTLNARRNEDVAALEDRLREAGIRYTVKVAPIWSNGAYHLELLVWPAGTAAGQVGQPSAHRVQQEIDQKLQHPLVVVRRVDTVAEGYLATLDFLGTDTPADVIARLQRNSTMFAEIQLVNESARADAPRVRVAQLRLRLR